nr:GNAT family N-acetyltransferase [Pseudoruegeria sp. HB172150]
MHLAGEDDLVRLLPLIEAYHAFEGIQQDDETRRTAVLPMLQGSPHGAIWLIGLRRAPVGYIAISFGWSIELGGMDSFIDEFFIRENVRGRGMGTEVLTTLLPQLAQAGVKAVHLEVSPENANARKIYAARGFKVRDQFHLMTWQP